MANKDRQPIVRVNAKSQQFAMKTLGIYSGPIDGIWSRLSIAASKEWQRLHGGANKDGGILKDPHRLPRHFVWGRLDNQEFAQYQDPTGKITAEDYVKAFIEACDPKPLEAAKTNDQSAATLRAVAEEKSEKLRADQESRELEKAKKPAPNVDLSLAKTDKKVEHKKADKEDAKADGDAKTDTEVKADEKPAQDAGENQKHSGKPNHGGSDKNGGKNA